jgi:hypothetical protein
MNGAALDPTVQRTIQSHEHYANTDLIGMRRTNT